MIETITAILFLAAIVFVAMGPKSSTKKEKDSGAPGSSTPKTPESTEKK
jgi:hypothetical protein